LDAQIYAIGINDPALDPFAGLRRWFFEDITRQGIRRHSLTGLGSSLSDYWADVESHPDVSLRMKTELTTVLNRSTVRIYPQRLVKTPNRNPAAPAFLCFLQAQCLQTGIRQTED